jgi:RNAse (barnase) inhibitor barstar
MKYEQFLFILVILASCNKAYNKEERLIIEVLNKSIKLTEDKNYLLDGLMNEEIRYLNFSRLQTIEFKLRQYDSAFNLSKSFSISNYGQNNLDSLYSILDSYNLSVKHKFRYKKLIFDNNNDDSISFLIYKLNYLNLILEFQNQIYYNFVPRTISCWSTEYRPFFIDLKMGFTANSTDSLYILTAKPYKSKLINHVTLRQKGKIISVDTLFGDYYKPKKLKKGEYTIECQGYRYDYIGNDLIKEKDYFSHNFFDYKVE